MDTWITEQALPYIEKHGRRLEYLLTLHLFQQQDDKIIKELLPFQNEDGGFGHGLEPDSLLPHSCVVHTNMAIEVLEQIEDENKKLPIIKGIVHFFETSYLKHYNGWYLTRKEVDDYPHAVWWNFDTIEDFTYGNPTPQVVGFLYRYQQFMTTLNIDTLIQNVVTYIKGPFLSEVSQHSLMSTLLFYEAMPVTVQREIKDVMLQALHNTIETTPSNWEGYACEPYRVITSQSSLGYDTYKDILIINLQGLKDQLMSKGYIEPNWHWGQYDKEWETIAKPAWSGLQTYSIIRILHEFGLL